jgi:hypothetical protein
LNVELENRDRPLIIDFYATWCGPCVLLAKELEQASAERGRWPPRGRRALRSGVRAARCLPWWLDQGCRR